jgi:hypothetical protein
LIRPRVSLLIGEASRPELVGTLEDPDLAAMVAKALLDRASLSPATSPLERGRRETLRELSAWQRPRLEIVQ